MRNLIAHVYIWLIGRNLCLCRFHQPMLSALCGRLDDLMIRWEIW